MVVPALHPGLIRPQDTLWSAQEDDQLIGRVWRHPQTKNVIVYRIIAADTQDVFLNNISFAKAAIHEAFTNSTSNLRQFPKFMSIGSQTQICFLSREHFSERDHRVRRGGA